MTAVEYLVQQIFGEHTETWKEEIKHALEMEKQQKKQIVLNILYHELGHDDTARWIAERLEAGKIDINVL